MQQGALMFLIALFLVLPFTSHAAKMDKEFACFKAMNQSSRSEDVIMDGKVAIHPIDGFSFYTMSATSVQKCRVPTKANLAPDGREGAGPWLVRITDNKIPYHIQYPQPREHLDLKGSPAWANPECTAASTKAVAELLDNRMTESRLACREGKSLPPCLAGFVERLKACEGIPSLKDLVKEIGRPAAVHAAPPGSAPQTGR